MRKIKFRAWDKQDRRMITHEQDFIPLKVTNLGVLRLNPNIEKDNWEFMDRDRFYLMQSTGLKDRNGKDIYEGDILVTGLCIHKCIVIFENGSFNLQTIKKDTQYLNNAFWNKSKENEVIGNIYENEELLK